MVFFEWDPRLETGEPDIDFQHQGLFALANELQTCVSTGRDEYEVVTDAVYRLIDYVIQHFHDEEALMERLGYPGTNAHRNLHERLTEETVHITTRFINGEDLFASDLALFITSWLGEHIKRDDMKFVDYIRTHEPVGLVSGF